MIVLKNLKGRAKRGIIMKHQLFCARTQTAKKFLPNDQNKKLEPSSCSQIVNTNLMMKRMAPQKQTRTASTEKMLEDSSATKSSIAVILMMFGGGDKYEKKQSRRPANDVNVGRRSPGTPHSPRRG